jgi:hypothetical protein
MHKNSTKDDIFSIFITQSHSRRHKLTTSLRTMLITTYSNFLVNNLKTMHNYQMHTDQLFQDFFNIRSNT